MSRRMCQAVLACVVVGSLAGAVWGNFLLMERNSGLDSPIREDAAAGVPDVDDVVDIGVDAAGLPGDGGAAVSGDIVEEGPVAGSVLPSFSLRLSNEWVVKRLEIGEDVSMFAVVECSHDGSTAIKQFTSWYLVDADMCVQTMLYMFDSTDFGGTNVQVHTDNVNVSHQSESRSSGTAITSLQWQKTMSSGTWWLVILASYYEYKASVSFSPPVVLLAESSGGPCFFFTSNDFHATGSVSTSNKHTIYGGNIILAVDNTLLAAYSAWYVPSKATQPYPSVISAT